MRRSGVQPTRKTSVTDLVTPADHAAEALIVNRLRAARPEDGIVAEEGSSQPGRRTWFVDPVDGTYNYATGVTLWCSAVGLADGSEPVLGAVYHPAADDLWSGGTGRPTTRKVGGGELPASHDHAGRLGAGTAATGAATRRHGAYFRLGVDRAGLGGRWPARRVFSARLSALGLAARRRARDRGRR